MGTNRVEVRKRFELLTVGIPSEERQTRLKLSRKSNLQIRVLVCNGQQLVSQFRLDIKVLTQREKSPGESDRSGVGSDRKERFCQNLSSFESEPNLPSEDES